MKTRAAVLRKADTPREITELGLDPPKASEVLIQLQAAGLRHSDEHIRSRGRARLPMAGGHEGAGTADETDKPILIGCHRKMHGFLSGGADPLSDVPLNPSLRHERHIKLTELITRKCGLDEINEGYRDLMVGKDIRGGHRAPAPRSPGGTPPVPPVRARWQEPPHPAREQTTRSKKERSEQ